MKILVYGKTGQVANCLKMHAIHHGFDCEIFSQSNAQIDDFEKLNQIIQNSKPDILINAAAYNNVDGAEDDFEQAKRINSIGPQTLTKCAESNKIPFIHISTDYVFDGEKNGLYDENDATNPINKYGESKLLGEELVLSTTQNCLIMRVSWVFSEFSNNFVKAMLKLANSGKENLSIVDDQIGIPTSAHDIANAILIASKRLIDEPLNNEIRGIFHFTSINPVNRFEYAKYVFQKAKSAGLKYCDISPIKSDQFPTKAKRPQSTPLNAQKFAVIFNQEINNWQNSLDEIFENIIRNIE